MQLLASSAAQKKGHTPQTARRGYRSACQRPPAGLSATVFFLLRSCDPSLPGVPAAVPLTAEQLQAGMNVLFNLVGSIVLREESGKILPLQTDVLLLVGFGLCKGGVDQPAVQGSDVVRLM